MVQETFLRLIASGKAFENQRHEKAWLIVTASNLCKDQLKRLYRTDEDLDDHAELAGDRGRKQIRFWRRFSAYPRTIRRRCISTTMRAIPPEKLPDSCTVPSPRSAPGLPVPENN